MAPYSDRFWLIPGSAAICALALLVMAAPVRAQAEGTHTRAVLAGGVSFAGSGPETRPGYGLAGHLGLRHQQGRVVFSARAGTNVGGSSPSTIPGGLHDRFDELAVLAGYSVYRSDNAQVVLSAGLAAVSGERVVTRPGLGTRNERFGARVGYPIQIALSAPGPGSSFGLMAHANLNPEERFGAVIVTYLIPLGGS